MTLKSAYASLIENLGVNRLEQSATCLDESRTAIEKSGLHDLLGIDHEVIRATVQQDRVQNGYNAMLAATAKSVEDVLHEQGACIPCDVFVGSFPLGDVNAAVQRVPDGALILVNDGLMQVLYQVSKIFVLSLDWVCGGIDEDGSVAIWQCGDTDEEKLHVLSYAAGWENSGWTHQQSVEAVTAILHANMHFGSATYAPRHRLPRNEGAVTLGAIVHYAEFFVLAHEYAHLVAEHVCLAELSTAHGVISDVLQASRQQEFEADELAAAILLRSANWNSPDEEFDVNARVAGISLVFIASLLLELHAHGPNALRLEPSDSDDHPPATARLLRVLASIHRRCGKNCSYLARALVGWKMAILSRVASSVENLKNAILIERDAQSLYEQDKFSEAEPLFGQVISIREAALGASDLSLAAPLSNLGNCVSKSTGSDSAKGLLLRSLAICEAAGGIAGDYLSTSLNNVAMFFWTAGDYELADQYFVRCLESSEARLAIDPGTYRMFVDNYLGCLAQSGRMNDMERVCERSAFATRRVLGIEHPDYMVNAVRLAFLYNQSDRAEDAISLAEEVVNVSRDVMGSDHWLHINALDILTKIRESS